MKKLKLLWMILKRTKATQILSGYIVFLFVSAAIIQLVEPDINHYGDALWYCYAVLSTAGFGDIVAITFIGKLVSVLVTIYTIFVVAIVTGVVVNYYGQIVEMQRRETAMMFLDKLERLPELSKEELEDISKRVKNFTQRNFCFPLFSYQIRIGICCLLPQPQKSIRTISPDSIETEAL